MTFSLFEIGNRSGRPVHLYEFAWGETVWRYTSADRDITFDDLPWTAIAISDGGVVQGGQAVEFEISIPANLPIVDLFRSTPPATPITVRALVYHRDDPDLGGVVYWTGTVGNVKRKDRSAATIFGLPLSATFRRVGLRLCWERGCPHMLYDEECRVDKASFSTATTITAMTGTTITVGSIGAFTAERYAGGYFEWEASVEGTIDRRGIESSAGGLVFNVFGSTDRLEIGQAITLYCGCDLTAETCDTFFDNLSNHGGHEYMPRKSPFDGDPIY